MIYALIAIGALLALLIAVVIIRALLFKPQRGHASHTEPVSVDAAKAAYSLSEMIKCKTISSVDTGAEDEAEFSRFKAKLPELFPNIFNACEYTELGTRAIMIRCKGRSSDAPTVLMAHYDVVSADENLWQRDPFGGEIVDGVLWGRGAIDTKITLNAAMQALEMHLINGFVPQNDIYLAFSGEEEICGTGAKMIVDLFEQRGITPGLVLDEGGAVVENVFPGVSTPCAVVGIGEKGMLNAEFTFTGNGGHASAPKRHTPVGRLSSACVRVENNPFSLNVPSATRMMFDTLARHSSFIYRIIFANLWLFSPVLDVIGKRSGGDLNALTRTTCAFTQMEGSKGMNVIPPKARMVANLRIIPGESCESALEYLRSVVNDADIKVSMIGGMDPSRTSVAEGDGWERVKLAIENTFDGVIVSPYLMFACSDSRHWGRISDKVYRFSPVMLTSEERATIHGNDERISVEKIRQSVEFYVRLISSL